MKNARSSITIISILEDNIYSLWDGILPAIAIRIPPPTLSILPVN